MSSATWADFFAMGGYALYVWGSYGVTAALILMEVIVLIVRKRAVLRQLAGADMAHQS